MQKHILIAASLVITLGLFGCQMPNRPYTVYLPGGPVDFVSPYDDPSMYRGGGMN
jgi:hypothetical protein